MRFRAKLVDIGCIQHFTRMYQFATKVLTNGVNINYKIPHYRPYFSPNHAGHSNVQTEKRPARKSVHQARTKEELPVFSILCGPVGLGLVDRIKSRAELNFYP